MDDLLIKGALVYDGTGAQPAIKDVAVSADKIRAIGTNLPESAHQVIDGTGLALMPGIIDSHTHFDVPLNASGPPWRWDASEAKADRLFISASIISLT